MGFLDHVSCVLLFFVGIILILEVHHSVDAEQTIDLQYDLKYQGGINQSVYLSSLGGSTRLLWPDRIRFKENATAPAISFSTRFKVDLILNRVSTRQVGYGSKKDAETNKLEGFTFAMIPEKLNASYGSDGGYLGLLNATSDGDPDSRTLAVEFDFVNNPKFSDPDGEDGGYHIGIDINSMNSTAWAPMGKPGYSNEWPSSLHVGSLSEFVWQLSLHVWIDYDSSVGTLNVTVADNNAGHGCPLSGNEPPYPAQCDPSRTTKIQDCNFLSHKVDLSTVLNEHMYVGFTSSHQDIYDLMYVDAWTLRTTSSGPSALSASLPCKSPSVIIRSGFHTIVVIILQFLAFITFPMGITVLVVFGCINYRRWAERRAERRGWRFDRDGLAATELHKFSFKELALATNKFDSKLLLGRGGFGSVYKGFLPGNKEFVAVKRVAQDSDQGVREFLAEVMIIGKIRHRNLVRLLGWCHERGELLLVYDLMPNGSLDKLLFGSHNAPVPSSQRQQVDVESLETVVVEFPWEKRLNAVVDVAKALVYLHTQCEKRIIHRDVKAANVMLDAKFNARLGDFGLARSYDHSLLAPESTNVAGTCGYLAPEVFPRGNQTEQTDVFSYGAFLLEVACGKKPIHHEGNGEVVLLVDHVWELWGDSNILNAVDPNLGGVYNANEITIVLCLGLLCSHPDPAMRPTMHLVLLILNGEASLPQVPLAKPSTSYGFERSFSLGSNSTATTDPSLYHISKTN